MVASVGPPEGWDFVLWLLTPPLPQPGPQGIRRDLAKGGVGASSRPEGEGGLWARASPSLWTEAWLVCLGAPGALGRCQGGPSSQTPPPKLSPVAPLSWRYPNTQPQVGVGQQCCVCQVPLSEWGLGEHTPLLQPELRQKQLSGFPAGCSVPWRTGPQGWHWGGCEGRKRMGWSGAQACSPSSCPSQTLRPHL